MDQKLFADLFKSQQKHYLIQTMFSWVLAALVGVISGIVTGLIPGLHPNTVIFTSLPAYLSTEIQKMVYISYVTGLSVSHTFHDFLPAIFISAPEAESALSVVASPELVEKGKGLEAFYSTVRGGLNSVLAVGILILPMLFFLKPAYSFISGFMEYILAFFLFYILLSSDDFFVSLVVAIFSGSLGLIAFNTPVNQQFVLIPVFSGLFAVPGVYSILNQDFEVPEQQHPNESVFSLSRHGFAGSVSGLLAGTVPGIGAAVSTSFVSPIMDESKKGFLSAMGGVNTSDIFFSLISLAVIDKARSGASVAIQAIGTSSSSSVFYLLLLAFLMAPLAAYLSVRVSKMYVDLIEGSSIEYIAYPVLVLIPLICFLLTGWRGMLVLGAASSVGFVAQRTDSRKACMSVLIIPTLISFSGITIFI
jgi:putative membrane protein